MVKISVVVAVYNPGQEIDRLLASFDAQTMPHDEFEIIFADDDSTDGTRERLQEWARARSNVQVLHNTPNSGWPGRPRNLGIDAANGEFVFFADNDDKFTPRAFEWMYDYAHANGSDVVIPKEVGVGPARGVMGPVYRKNVADAKLGKDPVLGVLTPHKLVRTSLLRDHNIRFPEGRVRLEDHYVIVSAYFAAKRISILADRVCYYWMRRESEGENAQFSSVDPKVYYEGVVRALEVVEANTKPGDFRNKLYSHWYNTKMLARLGDGLLARTPESRKRLIAAVRDVSSRFDLDDRMLPYLGAGARARALLLHHGTAEDLCALAKVNRVGSEAEVEELRWTRDGKLSLRVRTHFVYAESEKPITLSARGGRVYWDAAELGVPLEPIDVTDRSGDAKIDVLATDRKTHEMRYLVSTSEPVKGTDQIAATVRVVIDPADIFRDKPAGSIIDLRTLMTGVGWTSVARIPVPESMTAAVNGPTARYGRATAYPTQTYRKLSLRLVKRAKDLPQEPGPGASGESLRRLDWRDEAERYARGALRRARRGAGRVRREVGERLHRR